VNVCRRCGENFGSIGAFDAHRKGRHDVLWSPEQEDGRRCLDVDELRDLGWHRDKRGQWRQPISYDAVLRLRERAGVAGRSRKAENP
jgi:hypothetical protein